MLIDDVSLRPLLAYGNIIHDKRGRVWDPRLHPRGHDGKFIRTGGHVKILGVSNNVVGTGIVRGILPDGRIWVDPAGGGAPQFVRPTKIDSIEYKARLDNNINVNRPDRNGAKIGVGDSVYLPNNEIGKVTNTGDGFFEVTKTDGTVVKAKPQRLRAVNPTKDAEPRANLSLLDHSGTHVGDYQATTKDVKPAARKLGKGARTSGQSLLNAKNGDTVEGITVHVPGNEQTFKGDRITVKNLRAYLANNKDVLNGADPRVHLSAVVTTNPDGSKSITLSTPRVYGKNELAAALADAQANNGTLSSVHNNTPLDANPHPGESNVEHRARLNNILAGDASKAPDGPNPASPVGATDHPGTDGQGSASPGATTATKDTPADPVKAELPADGKLHDDFNPDKIGLTDLRKISAQISARDDLTNEQRSAALLLDGLIGGHVDDTEHDPNYDEAMFHSEIANHIFATQGDRSLDSIDPNEDIISALLNLADNPDTNKDGHPVLRRATLADTPAEALPVPDSKPNVNDIKKEADKAKLGPGQPPIESLVPPVASPENPATGPQHAGTKRGSDRVNPIELSEQGIAAKKADDLASSALASPDQTFQDAENLLPEEAQKLVARRGRWWLKKNRASLAEGDIRVLVDDLKDLSRNMQERVANGTASAEEVRYLGKSISDLADMQRGLVNLNDGHFTLQKNLDDLQAWADEHNDQGLSDAVRRLSAAADANSIGAPAADRRVGKKVDLDAPQRVADVSTALEVLKNSRAGSISDEELNHVQETLTRLGETIQDVQLANNLLADIQRGLRPKSRSAYDFQGIAKMLRDSFKKDDLSDSSKIRVHAAIGHMLEAVEAADATDLGNPDTRLANLERINNALHAARLDLGSYQEVTNANGVKESRFVPGEGLDAHAHAAAAMHLDFQRGLARYIGGEAFIRGDQQAALSHIQILKDRNTGELIFRQPHGSNMRLWRRKRQSKYDETQVVIGNQKYELGTHMFDRAGNPAQIVRMEPRGQHRFGKKEGVRLYLDSYDQQGRLTKSIVTVNEKNSQTQYRVIRPADFADPEELRNSMDVYLGELDEGIGGYSPKILIRNGWSRNKALNIQSANRAGPDARSMLRGWDPEAESKLKAVFETGGLGNQFGEYHVNRADDGSSVDLTVKDAGGASAVFTIRPGLANLHHAEFVVHGDMDPTLREAAYRRFNDWAVANHVTSVNIGEGTFSGRQMGYLGFDWNFKDSKRRAIVANNLLDELRAAQNNPPTGVDPANIQPYIDNLTRLFKERGGPGNLGNLDLPAPQEIIQLGVPDVLNNLNWGSAIDPVVPDNILEKMNLPAMMVRRGQLHHGRINNAIDIVQGPNPLQQNLHSPTRQTDVVPSAGRAPALDAQDIAFNDPAILDLARPGNASPAEYSGDDTIGENLTRFTNGELLQGSPEYKQAINTLRGRAAHAQAKSADPAETKNLLETMDRLTAKNTLSPEHEALISPFKDTITVQSIHRDGAPEGWQKTQRAPTGNINDVVRIQHVDTGLVVYVKGNDGWLGTEMNKGEVEGSRAYNAMGVPVGEQYYGAGDTTFSVDLTETTGITNLSHPIYGPNENSSGLEVGATGWNNPADIITQVIGSGVLFDADHHNMNLMTADDELGVHMVFMDFGLGVFGNERNLDAYKNIDTFRVMGMQTDVLKAGKSAASGYSKDSFNALVQHRLDMFEKYLNSGNASASPKMKDFLLKKLQETRALDLSLLFGVR